MELDGFEISHKKPLQLPQISRHDGSGLSHFLQLSVIQHYCDVVARFSRAYLCSTSFSYLAFRRPFSGKASAPKPSTAHRRCCTQPAQLET